MQKGENAGKRVLEIEMFGSFSMKLNGEELEFPGGIYNKTTRLFLLLAYHGERGILRKDVREYLYGDGDYANDSGNLRVAVYRLKKQLTDLGILSGSASLSQKGLFRLSDEGLELIVDVKEFEAAAARALGADSDQEELLRQACEKYTGEFLPQLSGEIWVAGKQATYQELYFRCAHQYMVLLEKRENYGRMLTMARNIIRLYPYEEWYAAELDALMGMERWREALEVSEQSVKNLMDKMGVRPSEELEKRVRKINNQLKGSSRSLSEIRKELEEQDNSQGAYFCNYSSFVGTYRYEVRMIERTGESLYLVLCTLTVAEDKRTKIDDRLVKEAIERLGNSIHTSLRRTDAYTHYGRNQYLMLLVGLKQEDCPVIFMRIEKSFEKYMGTGRFKLHHFVTPVISANQVTEADAAPIKFNRKGWKSFG